MAVASFGGVKATESIVYNKNVKYFCGLRTQLNDVLAKDYKNYTIAKWEDSEIWKKSFERTKGEIKHHLANATKVKTPEELRDKCYEYVIKDSENCNPSSDWCEACTFERDWYEGKYKNE